MPIDPGTLRDDRGFHDSNATRLRLSRCCTALRLAASGNLVNPGAMSETLRRTRIELPQRDDRRSWQEDFETQRATASPLRR